jgi:hypothetical protein
MTFINESTSTGVIINYLTNNVTGDLFLTLLLILVCFLTFCMVFRIPLEYTVPLVLPLLLVYMSFTSQFLAVGGVLLIYSAVVFVKMFFIN